MIINFTESFPNYLGVIWDWVGELYLVRNNSPGHTKYV